MERSYPNQLAQQVRESWPAHARPLPGRIAELLDAAYHASFLRDEERPVTCRLIVLPPAELPPDCGPPSGLLPLVFATPRALDEDELRRLSPAATVHRALVGIDDSADMLRIWGIVQSGPRWLQAAQGGRAKEPPMPPCLVVRIVRPGNLVVSCGAQLVAELRGGRLTNLALDVFQSQWLPARFREARALMAAEHAASSPAALPQHIAGALAGYMAQQMMKRVIATLRAAHHGGTLLVGPPDCVQERYLQTKYPFGDLPSRRRFQGLALAILKTLARRAAATGREAGIEFYRNEEDPQIAELDEGLFELSHLMASFAVVDGAVVLTKRFEILGFGAEIAGSLAPVGQVRRALDLEADQFVTEVVDGVGTRHRSAYRLCAAVPQAVAVVVSQDADVRFVTRHRDAVTYWEHAPSD